MFIHSKFLLAMFESLSRRLSLCGAPQVFGGSAGYLTVRQALAQSSRASNAAPARAGSWVCACAFDGSASLETFFGVLPSEVGGDFSAFARAGAVAGTARVSLGRLALAGRSVFQSVTGLAANTAVNGTPNCCAVWFPPLRSGARYLQR
ncbi:hypothetical protein OPU71_21005 [Niveibacterium sp. 24ML]|uniref:hypothetical protein n=1 Tax=Niveibacterium sp. 24ML TaxID=2985512 RepID=UPI002270DD45|nr:hypothetical protein [Niveibacterium sp. 24ML]MCX9158600.1 hypothetical protein [Niveibacterium sp. 24ML]